MTSIYDWSTTPASNATVGSISWAENQAPSTVNNSARQEMADVAAWRDFLGGAKVSSGTDTITLTSGLSLSAYAQGQMFAFEAGGTNTSAVTLNVDSVGAKAIKKYHDVALASGDIETGGIYLVAYEGASDEFLLLSPVANAPGDLLASNNLSDVASASTAFSNIKQAASTSATGVVELATQAEVDAGSDATRAVTPSTLANASDIIPPAAVTGSVNADTSTSLTLALADAFKTVTCDNASAVAVTIPANASVAFSTGDRIDIWQKGAGQVTVSGDTGVTLNGVSAGGGAISAQYSAVSIVKIGTDEWLMSGNHAAVA